MLAVSIHTAPLSQANRFNRVALLSIVYEQLSPVADYKLFLQEVGRDSNPTRLLQHYPRWSASLWDLTARALAICLPDVRPHAEEVPEFAHGGKKRAFAQELTIVLDHVGHDDKRSTLGTASILQAGRRRGIYQANFDEHTMKPHRTAAFAFTPETLRPAELLLHACLHRLTGKPELPARPGLCAPPPVTVDGLPHIQVHQLLEPARTGFQVWLTWSGKSTVEYSGAPLGVSPEALYIEFLRTAI